MSERIVDPMNDDVGSLTIQEAHAVIRQLRGAIVILRAPAAAPAGRRKHDGDCTIYAALINGRPEDGICTCGHGRRVWHDSGSLDAMYSDERLRALPAASVGADALAKATALCTLQAEDDGLWFEAQTAPEAYLQAALRKLHAAVEGVRTPAAGPPTFDEHDVAPALARDDSVDEDAPQ